MIFSFIVKKFVVNKFIVNKFVKNYYKYNSSIDNSEKFKRFKKKKCNQMNDITSHFKLEHGLI